MKLHNWLVIIGFVVLFGWCVIINNQYNSLKLDYEQLKYNKEYLIDSLQKDNVRTKQIIKVLEDSLKTLDVQILENVNKVESFKSEEFDISINLSKSANLLKENLCADL